MIIPNPFTNKTFKYTIIISAVIGLIYTALRLLFFTADPLIPFFTSIYKFYLFLPELIANQIFGLLKSGVKIVNHEFIFENNASYQLANNRFLINWTKFLLYQNWSILLLVLIWGVISDLKNKIKYTIYFFLTHVVSVVGGLYLLAIAGPYLFVVKPRFALSPTLLGTLFMFTFLVVWIKKNFADIQKTFQKLKLPIVLQTRKTAEVLVILFVFLLLRSFIIPFFDFPHYVNFLLGSTNWISSFFNQTGYIEGDQLVGEYGSLALSKHCLGFMTMFVFTSLIYLTRPEKKRVTYVYIALGLLLLHISNLVRLVSVFIVAQGEDGFNRANKHHDIYNIGIYIFIFLLWILWFEFFISKRQNNKIRTENVSEK